MEADFARAYTSAGLPEQRVLNVLQLLLLPLLLGLWWWARRHAGEGTQDDASQVLRRPFSC